MTDLEICFIITDSDPRRSTPCREASDGAEIMSHSTYPDTIDPGEAAAFFKSLLVRTFKDRESLQRAIRETKERGDHARY